MKKILTKDILERSFKIMKEEIDGTKREGIISRIKDAVSKKLNSLDTNELKSFMDRVMIVREGDEEPLKNLIDTLLSSDLVDTEDVNTLMEEEIVEGKSVKGTIGKTILALGLTYLGVVGAIDMRNSNEVEHQNQEAESSKVKEDLKKMVVPQNVMDYLKSSNSNIYDRVLDLATTMHLSNENPPSRKDLYDYIMSEFSKTKSFKKIVEDTDLNDKELAKYISLFVYNMYEKEIMSESEEIDEEIIDHLDVFNKQLDKEYVDSGTADKRAEEDKFNSEHASILDKLMANKDK